MRDLNIEFPLDDFEKLISQIGWSSLDEWFNFWNLKKEMLSINNFWDDNVKDDWIWGLALPLLSQAYKLNKKSPERKIIGLGDSPNDLPLLLNSDYKIVIPGPDGPNLKLLEKLNDHKFTLATDPNGYGWKSEINKLINNFVLNKR